MTKYYGRQLPSGNSSDFPSIDRTLAKLRIPCTIYQLNTGGRIYLISEKNIEKLPFDFDANQYYIPNTIDSGYSIYQIPKQDLIDALKKESD